MNSLYKVSDLSEDIKQEIGIMVDEVNSFEEEFGDIIKYLSPEDYETASGLTLEQMEDMTMRDVYEAIRAKRGYLKEGCYWHQRRNPIIINKTVKVKQKATLNDAVTKKAFDNEESGDIRRFKQDVSGNEVFAKVMIDFTAMTNVKTSKVLTPFEKVVYEGIVSNYLAGNEYMTIPMIYKAIVGNSRITLNKEREKEIRTIILKFLSTSISIVLESVDEDGDASMDNINGQLISGKHYQGFHKGIISEWLHVSDVPALYEFASPRNQVITKELEFFDTKFKKTNEIIVLQSYLFTRINTMKHLKKHNPSRFKDSILIDNIYNAFEIDDSYDAIINMDAKEKASHNMAKKRARERCERILDDFIEKEFITSYEVVKSGTSVEKYRIKF